MKIPDAGWLAGLIENKETFDSLMRPARLRQILQHQDIPWRCLNPQSAKENTHTCWLRKHDHIFSLSTYPFLSEWTMERLDEVATAIKPKKKVLFKVKKKLDEKIQQQHAIAAPNGDWSSTRKCTTPFSNQKCFSLSFFWPAHRISSVFLPLLCKNNKRRVCCTYSHLRVKNFCP